MPPGSNRVLWVGVLLVGLGLARIVYYDGFVIGSLSRGRTIDARYASLKAQLPEETTLGFLTDERFADPLDSLRYTQALYALAPRILILNDGEAKVWVADFVDAGALRRLAAERGLELSLMLDEGHLAILRPKDNR